VAERPENPEHWEPQESGPLTRASTAFVRMLLFYAVVLLAYSIYSHERWITGASQIRAYVLPLAAIILFAIVLRLGPSIRIAAALSIIPLIAMLIAANLLFAQPEHLLRRSGWHWLVERKRAAATVRLREQGKSVYPYVTTPEFVFGEMTLTAGGKQILPLSGISRVQTVVCDEGGLVVTYLSDEYGFNNPRGLWNGDSISVAILGDSFVFGSCVPPREHFVNIVRNRIPRTLNFGGSGNGPLTELAILREYAAAARPSKVLWVFFEGNDMEDLEKEKKYVLRRYLDPSFTQNLREQQGVLDSALILHADSTVRMASRRKPLSARAKNLVLLRDLRMGLAPRPQRAVLEPDFALLKQVLAEARRTVNAWGGSMSVVYLPEEHRTNPSARNAIRARELDIVRSRVTQIANELDIPLLDIASVFERDPNPRATWWPPRTHYSPYGNRVVAEAILNHLR
jgi:hypothetical protein